MALCPLEILEVCARLEKIRTIDPEVGVQGNHIAVGQVVDKMDIQAAAHTEAEENLSCKCELVDLLSRHLVNSRPWGGGYCGA